MPDGEARARWLAAAARLGAALALLGLHVLAVAGLGRLLWGQAFAAFALLEALAIALAVGIQSGEESAGYKQAWTLLVVAVPVAGALLFLLWGGLGRRHGLLPLEPPEWENWERRQSQEDLDELGRTLPGWRRLARMLEGRGFLLRRDTAVTYFPSGAALFEDALGRMARAERFIFLEFYILAEGRLWDRMLPILAGRIRQGVEVKVIFDDLGSSPRLRKAAVEQLRSLGAEVYAFSPVLAGVNQLCFNFRDHRKIICVDGQFSYTGGINIADEYAGLRERFGEWKDSGLLLEGAGAWGLTREFIHMWQRLGGSLRAPADSCRPMSPGVGEGWCQVFSGSPEAGVEDVFLQAIAAARHSVWLTTPYFAADDSLVRALCAAAEGGVDVRVLLPGVADHWYTRQAARSHYDRLLRHGVRIYEFTPGFLHAKSFVADGEAAFVGSVNLDYRGLCLNYECGALLYGTPAVRRIRADLQSVMARSQEIELARWRQRPRWKRALEKVLRVFSIWM